MSTRHRYEISFAGRGFERRAIYFLVFGLMLAAAFVKARADDLSVGFDAANKLYEQGKYADAANAYDKLLTNGTVSEAIYFNRGNAWFKAGQVGRAIASYRQARLLAPRDSALRANLQLARTRARGGSMYRSDRWRDWLGRLNLNEWAVLTAMALWAFFILLAAGQWQTEFRARLRSYLLIAGAAAVLFGLCLTVSYYSDYGSPTAIVVAGEAEVRNGPLDESVSLFKVRDGTELSVADKKDGWLQVVDAAQRIGWVRQNEVITFEPGKPRKAGS